MGSEKIFSVLHSSDEHEPKPRPEQIFQNWILHEYISETKVFSISYKSETYDLTDLFVKNLILNNSWAAFFKLEIFDTAL